MNGVSKAMAAAIPTSFDVAANLHGSASVSSADMATSAGTVINIYPQQLTESTIDYLYTKFNLRMGAQLA